jgi:hypothetical protein
LTTTDGFTELDSAVADGAASVGELDFRDGRGMAQDGTIGGSFSSSAVASAA